MEVNVEDEATNAGTEKVTDTNHVIDHVTERPKSVMEGESQNLLRPRTPHFSKSSESILWADDTGDSRADSVMNMYGLGCSVHSMDDLASLGPRTPRVKPKTAVNVRGMSLKKDAVIDNKDAEIGEKKKQKCCMSSSCCVWLHSTTLFRLLL